MAIVSASQASRLVGKSVPTITRAIKKGRLSAKPRDGGGWNIDTSALFSVFDAVNNNSDETPKSLGIETPNETSVLEREIELLREMLDETKADRDSWKEQAQKITALIEDQRPKQVLRWPWQKG